MRPSRLPTTQQNHWAAIERHPRLVFGELGPEEEDMVNYYLRQNKPFTVVITAQPNRTKENYAGK